MADLTVSLEDGLAREARERPDAPAILGLNGPIAFADLDRRGDVAAAGLAARGIGPGTCVAIALPRGADGLALVHGLLRLGAPFVPLDPAMPIAERDAVARATRAEWTVASGPGGAAGAGTLVLDDDWWADSATRPTAPRPDLPAAAPALFVRSSGTTRGSPKIALWSRAYLWRSASSSMRKSDPHGARYLCVIDLRFGVGLRTALRTLWSGGAIVLPPPLRRPEDLQSAIRDHGCNVGFFVPAMLRELSAVPRAAPFMPELDPLSVGTGATTPLDRRVFRERLSPNLAISMGTNEVGGVFALPSRHPKIDQPGAVGFPIGNIECVLIDGRGEPVPAGTIGALKVRAPGMPTGYLDGTADEDTGFRDGWFHTGDLMVMDADGCFHHRGRIDDEIDVGGQKMHPEEVEAVLAEHPDVVESAVVAWPGLRGSVPVAFVVLRRPVEPGLLRRHCADHLPAFKIPRRFRVVDRLPRNDAGKVMRRALRDSPR